MTAHAFSREIATRIPGMSMEKTVAREGEAQRAETLSSSLGPIVLRGVVEDAWRNTRGGTSPVCIGIVQANSKVAPENSQYYLVASFANKLEEGVYKPEGGAWVVPIRPSEVMRDAGSLILRGANVIDKNPGEGEADVRIPLTSDGTPMIGRHVIEPLWLPSDSQEGAAAPLELAA